MKDMLDDVSVVVKAKQPPDKQPVSEFCSTEQTKAIDAVGRTEGPGVGRAPYFGAGP